MAVTQLVPRTLEQSILHHFHCSINGDDQLVRFRYTSFNPSTLNSVLVLGKIAIPVKVVSKGIILPIYSSKQLLLLLLAVGSRRTIDPRLGYSRSRELLRLIYRSHFFFVFVLVFFLIYFYRTPEDKSLHATYSPIVEATKSLNLVKGKLVVMKFKFHELWV
jgi:hypothetical protein